MVETAKPKLIVDDIFRKFTTFIKAAPKFKQPGSGRLQGWFFLACALIFVFAQAYVTIVNIGHKLPIGSDDGYGYIQKAAEISDGCFLQDCPALTDLREQFLTPTSNVDSAYVRNREYTRLFVLYHPLHSFLLAGLHEIGFSLETAFDILYALGKILIPIAVIYWMVAIWGKPIAATALLLSAPLVFPSQGLSYSIPTTMAAGIAMALWAMILNRSKWTDRLMIPMVAAAVLMHNMGIFYSFVAVVLYFLFSTKPLQRKVLWIGVISLLVILGDIGLMYVIRQPALRFDPVSFYTHWNYLDSLKESLPSSLGLMMGFMKSFGYWFIFVILVTIGFLLTPFVRRTKVFVTAVMLVCLLAAGTLYVVPWYGAFTQARMWPFMGMFLIGALAATVNSIIAWLGNSLKVFTGRIGNLSNKSTVLNRNGWRIALSTFAVFLLVYSLGSYFSNAAKNYTLTAAAGQDVIFNPEQAQVISDSSGTGKILYMDELAMYYFMSHGGLNHGAIFQPALRHTSDLDNWLNLPTNEVTYVIQRSPTFTLPHTEDGGLLLNYGDSLVLTFSGLLEGQGVQFFIGPRASELILRATQDEEEMSFLRVPAGQAQWMDISFVNAETGQLKIELDQVGRSMTLEGIRVSDGQITRWPWDSGITLEMISTDGKSNLIDFSSSLLSENIFPRLKILDDYGYSLLAEPVTN